MVAIRLDETSNDLEGARQIESNQYVNRVLYERLYSFQPLQEAHAPAGSNHDVGSCVVGTVVAFQIFSASVAQRSFSSMKFSEHFPILHFSVTDRTFSNCSQDLTECNCASALVGRRSFRRRRRRLDLLEFSVNFLQHFGTL